jgi:sulfur carrier protein ThiS
MITVNEKKIKFCDGMAVVDAIREANEEISDITIIMVDKRIIHQNQLNEKINDEAKIKILKILSGG